MHATFERLFFRGPERNIGKTELGKEFCRNEAVILGDKIILAWLFHKVLNLKVRRMSVEMPGRKTHKSTHVSRLGRGRDAVRKEGSPKPAGLLFRSSHTPTTSDRRQIPNRRHQTGIRLRFLDW